MPQNWLISDWGFISPEDIWDSVKVASCLPSKWNARNEWIWGVPLSTSVPCQQPCVRLIVCSRFRIACIKIEKRAKRMGIAIWSKYHRHRRGTPFGPDRRRKTEVWTLRGHQKETNKSMVRIVANFAPPEWHATLLLSFRCLVGFCLQNH